MGAGLAGAAALRRPAVVPGAPPPPAPPPAPPSTTTIVIRQEAPADSGGGGASELGTLAAAAAIGAAVGSTFQSMPSFSKENKVSQIIAPIVGAAGGVAVVLVGGATTAGILVGGAALACGGYIALPIAVAVLAIISVANAIEDGRRAVRTLEIVAERDRIRATKGLRAAWDYAASIWEKEQNPAAIFYTSELPETVPMPNGQQVNIRAAIDEAYTVGKTILDPVSGAVMGIGGQGFGDRAAAALELALPWTHHGSYQILHRDLSAGAKAAAVKAELAAAKVVASSPTAPPAVRAEAAALVEVLTPLVPSPAATAAGKAAAKDIDKKVTRDKKVIEGGRGAKY